MPAQFENDEKSDGSKISASVHTMPAQFENGRKFDDKNWLQDLMPKNSTYTLRIDLSRSKSVEKCSVFIFVEC